MSNTTLTLGDGITQKLSGALSYVPSLQVLYHGDLSRIGEVTPKHTFEDGQWLPLGRMSPLFEAHPSSQRRSLADPYISRAQAAIRWNTSESCFEVKASPSARLPVSSVELRRGQPHHKSTFLTGLTLLPPGSLLNIGDRILLLLQHKSWHDPDEDRLGMVGETQEAWELRQLICDVAQFDSSVLILGETGVGKELVSQAVHSQSVRHQGPFVPTNCAALPEQLIESLLFGHVKGAFTGAINDSTGLFVTAKDGSLFLDEIGEMPMGLQTRLLRVLQERVIVPIGAKQGVPVNARVIAATNRIPDHEIEQGNLRSDLYYRLATHTIRIPSLYNRFLDVPLLFVHFLSKILESLPSLSWLWTSSPPSQLPIPMSFFLELLRHPWKGNIRELQNITEQTARLNLRQGPFTTLNLLNTTSASPKVTASPHTSSKKTSINDQELVLRASRKLGLKRKTTKRLLDQAPLPDLPEDKRSEDFVEALRQHLAESLYLLLERDDFNQTHVAEALGVSRGTLINLMKRFNLPRVQDLTLAQLQQAYASTGGKTTAMARLLKVSPVGLKARLKSEGLI